MKTLHLCPHLVIVVLSGWLALVLFAGVMPAMGAAEDPGAPKPEKTADSQPAKTNDSFHPSKYEFGNLPESQQTSIGQEMSTDNTESNSNQMLYDLREKQEDIRLYEVVLLAVMALCSLAIVLKYMKDSKACSARDMLNGTGLVLVIFSTVLVIIVADVEIQLTAAMGVLGGIAGYLFGTFRSSQPTKTEKTSAQTKE